MKICAVIPAAGRGSRLNYHLPKLLLPLSSSQTVWSILHNTLSSLVDHIHIIVSPQHQASISAALIEEQQKGFVSLSIQPSPIGMGDAIFHGYPIWSSAESILILWGDQVFVSQNTIQKTLQSHAGAPNTVALPLVDTVSPYVEYIFNSLGQLKQIHQSREGDHCNPKGLSDVGVFALSVANLTQNWQSYLEQIVKGQATGEINFLPFLVFLANSGWQIKTCPVEDPLESRGINTVDDWNFFKNKFSRNLL